MGRHTILTPALVEEAETACRNGIHLETIAHLLGIAPLTFRRWMQRGVREGRRLEKKGYPVLEKEQIFLEFSTRIKKALAEAEYDDIKAIRGDGSWQARAWINERRYPHKWSLQAKELRDLKKHVAALEKSIGERNPA